MPTAPRFPCSTCHKNVNNNHRAICCDLCDRWIHIKCNFLNLTDYNRLKNDINPFYCINCIREIFPSSDLTDNEFLPFVTKGITLPAYDEASTIFAPPSPHLQTHIYNLNSFLNKARSSPNVDDDDDDDTETNELTSPLNCNYYDYEEFNKANFESSKSFSILHYNIHSIQKHIESLRTLLLMLESESFEFDIIAISESKKKKKLSTQSGHFNLKLP